MNDSNLLPAAEMRKLKGIFDEPGRSRPGGNLERLHDARIDLMLDTSELTSIILRLTLSVLPDDHYIDIRVPGFDAWDREAQIDIGVQIEILVELVVVVVFGLDSLFGDHHPQQNTVVLLQPLPRRLILKRKIVDSVENNRHIGSIEDRYNAF